MSDTTTLAKCDIEAQTLRRLEATAERITGQSADVLRGQTLAQLRNATELKAKRKWLFVSRFPLIGRGSIMRERVIRHEEVEGMLTKVLG
jgi:uncharacterized protein with von Willebrand factor type A (vWA) domain